MGDLSKRLRDLADAMENGPYVSLKTIRDTFREAADALEWQPIEDAPEDLEFMLVGHWHPMAGWSPAIVSQPHVRRLKEGGDMGPRFYFMPLPQPPEGE